MDLKLLSLSTKLTFTVDKKTGQLPRGKDSVSIKASLALPAGISAANLPIHVDIVELHQQTQFTALGKPPVAPKSTAPVTGPFGFNLPVPPLPLNSKYTFTLKGTSVAGSKPVPFSFSSIGTLREELGRAGYTGITTPKLGTPLSVRVNITLGSTTFTGLAATVYKATQGKTGSAVTIKPK